MNRTIVFSELNQFYEELDLAISARATVKIIFHSTPPNSYSDLWKRLERCWGYSDLIPIDYTLARPEVMMPYAYARPLALFFPLLFNLVKFRKYLAFRLYTQRYQVGKLRRIVIKAK
jgi:hypothetical protein